MGPSSTAARTAPVSSKPTLSGQYTLLYSFPVGHYSLTALIEGSDGKLYGLLRLPGTSELFRITKAGQYTTLYVLSIPRSMGPARAASRWEATGSSTAARKGAASTWAALTSPSTWGCPSRSRARAIQPEVGRRGNQGTDLGSNLLSASVTFNGIPASSVTVSGPNYVWATVPAGASSGPITVTTPGGTNSTKGSFTVE